MATMYKTGEREAECFECGAIGVMTTYGGNLTMWDDEYEDRSTVTVGLSEGYAFECSACGYADGEPPQY